MTPCRSYVLAACVFALAAGPAGRCRAAEPVIAVTQTATTITLSTSSASAPAAATPSEPATSSSSTRAARRFFHRRRPGRRAAPPRSLPSRGGDSRATLSTSVVGRLGMVAADNAPIHAGRERYGRVLSVCPKGQYLAISGENETQYAVMMIDHSLGYIDKTNVQLLDYQVVTGPSAAEGGAAPGGAAAAAGGSLGLRLVQTAEEYLGVPYVWGGNTRTGIDCSGFVKAVYASYGITLPRHSGDQAAVGYDVPRADWSQWVPGDRMYFACHHPEIDHTGMYIGGGYFIHASVGHNHQVAIDRVDNAYYAGHLVAVRRSEELEREVLSSNPGAQTASADPEATQEH